MFLPVFLGTLGMVLLSRNLGKEVERKEGRARERWEGLG
jgi:hypothetical protein